MVQRTPPASNTSKPSSSSAELPFAPNPADSSAESLSRKQARRWWLKVLLQPVFLLVLIVVMFAGLGLVQKLGVLVSGSSPSGAAADLGAVTSYICPMMCTPPQSEPGRCPVCAMELVPATSSSSTSGGGIEISPAARRIANIQTTVVEASPLDRVIHAVGQIAYDEGRLKTLAAYVDGRLEKLYADYTGVVVEKGDRLALIFSPQLYSGQVELLLARKAFLDSQNSTLARVVDTNRQLYDSSRQRLIELGMTEVQIEHLEKLGDASSRLELTAPINGTVIEKLTSEGQYVKEGQAILKLADLTVVWLMLEMFPEDAASIRYGQKVSARIQSLPAREFSGRVAFVNPHVDPETRTVGVRVVMENSDGSLRVGDFAKATIRVPLLNDPGGPVRIYDPELADKWVSPRHPHIIAAEPGKCELCGMDLIPAAELGFTADPLVASTSLSVPRQAVLLAGSESVVYVESKPGQFELRRVTLGPFTDDRVVILDGLTAGERVATHGNFLIDSQMQLAGNPSLIDPTKVTAIDVEKNAEIEAALAKLAPADQELARQQSICPVTKMPLGSMGTPLQVMVAERPVWICCIGCQDRLQQNPDKYMANLNTGAGPAPASLADQEEQAAIQVALQQLSDTDRQLAMEQQICPVTLKKLGSMGKPVKVDVYGQPIFICCEGCRDRLVNDPPRYLPNLVDRGMPATTDADDDLRAAIEQGLAKLEPADRALAIAQRMCPVADFPLGGMGKPIKVEVQGTPVFICCEGCRTRLVNSPELYLAKVAKLRASSDQEGAGKLPPEDSANPGGGQ